MIEDQRTFLGYYDNSVKTSGFCYGVRFVSCIPGLERGASGLEMLHMKKEMQATRGNVAQISQESSLDFEGFSEDLLDLLQQFGGEISQFFSNQRSMNNRNLFGFNK